MNLEYSFQPVMFWEMHSNHRHQFHRQHGQLWGLGPFAFSDIDFTHSYLALCMRSSCFVQLVTSPLDPIKVAQRHQSGSRWQMALYGLSGSDITVRVCLTPSAWQRCVTVMSPDSLSLKKNPSLALRVLAVCIKHHYCTALLTSPESPHPFPMQVFCLPGEFWMKTQWVEALHWILYFVPCWASMNIKHQHKVGESAGRDQHYPYLMERESEFIDGKREFAEGRVRYLTHAYWMSFSTKRRNK